ncbi:MAG: hypothetical protein EBU81_16085, partial [Proteobacteria bacterium]|nr:hypothetical protein [Pseudomonadota bacterium]
MIHRVLAPGQRLVGPKIADGSACWRGSDRGFQAGQRTSPGLDRGRFAQSRQIGQRRCQGEIVDRPGRFEGKQRVGVGQERPDRVGAADSGRQQHQLAHLAVGVG